MKLPYRKRLIIAGAILVVAGSFGVAYALTTSSQKNTAATQSEQASPRKPNDDTNKDEVVVSSEPEQAPTPAPETPTPSTATPKPAPKPTTPSNTPPAIVYYPPLQFTAGAITPAYAYCAYGSLVYILAGSTVSANQPTSQSFSWHIELNDGSVSESGTSTMPNTSIWFSFPSTYDYPSSLGSVSDAADGDSARLVITSPNYSAGPWSAPVPAGSVAACQAGQM